MLLLQRERVRRRFRANCVCALIMVPQLGCSSKEPPRANAVGDCVENCAPLVSPRGGSSSSSDAGANSPGDAGPAEASSGTGTDAGASSTSDAGAAEASTGAVTVDLSITRDETFLTDVPFGGEASLDVLSPGGPPVRAAARSGQAVFDSLLLQPSWYAIVSDKSASDIRPTFGFSDFSLPRPHTTAVSDVVLTNIAQTLGVVLDAAASHAILVFRRNGVGVPGLIASLPTGANVVAAYDNGLAYVPAPTSKGTEARGTILLFNFPALPYPGSVERITASSPSGPLSVDLWMAQGFVTRISVDIP